ncbi:MAG: hypothetical protein DRI70_08340, partial [Bacteroidetes bacterium]
MQHVSRNLAVLLFISVFNAASAVKTEIQPSMDVTGINELLNAALPGDTLQFQAGTFKGPFILNNVHGAVHRPIVIQGISSEFTVIDGKASPGLSLQNQAFLLRDCS